MSTGTAPAGVAIDEQHDVNGPPAGPNVKARPAARLHGLDGIRGIAALFVVLHHCWLLSFPGYPSNTGPWWLGWLDLRSFRRRRVYRAVGLLFGHRSRPVALAAPECARLRPSTSLADPSAVLGGARVQPRRRLVGRRAASHARADGEIRLRPRLPRPGRLRLAEPQRRLLVDRDRGPALHPLSVASARQTTVGCGRASRIDDGDRDGHRWRSAARLARRHADASQPAVRRIVHGGHRRRRDPRRLRPHPSASAALVGAGRGRTGRADRGDTWVRMDGRQLRLGRPRSRAGDGTSTCRGRCGKTQAFRACAGDSARSSGWAPARTACTSPTRRSWSWSITPCDVSTWGRACRSSFLRSRSRCRWRSPSRCGSRRSSRFRSSDIAAGLRGGTWSRTAGARRARRSRAGREYDAMAPGRTAHNL